jgi:hypothetical protein
MKHNFSFLDQKEGNVSKSNEQLSMLMIEELKKSLNVLTILKRVALEGSSKFF